MAKVEKAVKGAHAPSAAEMTRFNAYAKRVFEKTLAEKGGIQRGVALEKPGNKIDAAAGSWKSDVLADNAGVFAGFAVAGKKAESEAKIDVVIQNLRNHEKKRGDAAIDLACLTACACSGRELGATAKAVFTVSGGRG